MKDRHLAIRIMLLPKDTNARGTIFGGTLLSHIDLAGAVEARRHTDHDVVTVAMNKVVFKEPVFVGDLLSFYTSLIRIGNTSLEVHVAVEALRGKGAREVIQVTQADVVYVAVDENRKKIAIASETP